MKQRGRGRSSRHRLNREDRAKLGRRSGRDKRNLISFLQNITISPLAIRIGGGAIGVVLVILILGQLLGRDRQTTPGEGPDESDVSRWMEEVELRTREYSLGAGIRDAWIILHPPGSPEGDSLLTVMEFRVPGDIPMEVLNLELTRAVQEAGGTVVRGVELSDARVELDVAWRGRHTHRFVLQRYSGYRSHVGSIGIVIDDFGRASQEMLAGYASLGSPWTASVIPGLPNSAGQARYFSARGIAVMLHMPMEPEAGEDWELGEGALYAGTPRDNVAALLESAFNEVPGATGLNNHMGSRATQESAVMRAVMLDLRERGLFFLDSRTTPASVAADEAERAGIPWAARQIFLDPEDEVAVIEEQFQQALDLARRSGSAIMIGHPRENTLAALRRLIPAARQEGFEFVTVDRLLHRSGRQ
ncbi:divergent polysaccharide deacetylase family protein [Gemmatimonadota bacterium]